MANIAEARQKANQIKTETGASQNSADRVGTALNKIIDAIEDNTTLIGGKSTVSYSGASIQGDTEKIGTLTIDGTPHDIEAPKGGDSGSGGHQKMYFTNVEAGSTPRKPLAENYHDSNDPDTAYRDCFWEDPIKWINTNDNPQGNANTFAIWVYFNSSVESQSTIEVIDGPVNLTGAGTNGEDGEEIEWIYTRRASELSDRGMSDLQTLLAQCFKKEDSEGSEQAGQGTGADWTNINPITKQPFTWKDSDVYPSGWTDNPQGIDANDHKYEYAAIRRSRNGLDGKRTWGDDCFHGPFLWSSYGKQGLDGDGVEYIFFASGDGTAPQEDTISDPSSWKNHTPAYPGTEWKDETDHSKGKKTFQDNEYIAADSGWMDNPIDLDESDLGQGAVEWVSMRKKQRGEWQSYSTPAVWSRLAKDGVPLKVTGSITYYRAVETRGAIPSPASAYADFNDNGVLNHWKEGEDPSWGSERPHLYYQEKTLYEGGKFSWGSVTYKGQWVEGGQTQPGDDGYTLIIDPAYAIFEEKVRRIGTNGREITYTDGVPSADFDHYEVTPIDLSTWTGRVQLLRGTEPQSFGISNASGDPIDRIDEGRNLTGDNCRFTVKTLRDTQTHAYLGVEITVYEIINLETSPTKIKFWVTLDGNYYSLIEIPIYLNRLGTQFKYVVGDTETIIMKKTVFEDVDGNPYQFNNLGEYLFSSSQSLSALKATVGDDTQGLVYNYSLLSQTADRINMSVNNGWYNYITNPRAIDATVSGGARTIAQPADDIVFGLASTMNLHREDGNDYELIHAINENRRGELTGEYVTWFCVVYCTALYNGYAQLYFGSGYQDGKHYHEAIKMTATNPNEPEGGTNLDDSYCTDRTTGRISLGRSWYLFYTTAKLNPYQVIDPGTRTVGFNSMMGTWRIYYAGIILGKGVPTLDMIMTYNGLESAGIDITQGEINLSANNTNFVNPQDPQHPNIWIDNINGTLHAKNGEFTGNNVALTSTGVGETVDTISYTWKGLVVGDNPLTADNWDYATFGVRFPPDDAFPRNPYGRMVLKDASRGSNDWIVADASTGTVSAPKVSANIHKFKGNAQSITNGGVTLDTSCSVVLVNHSGSDISIYLPSSGVEDGFTYYIFKKGNYSVYIRTSDETEIARAGASSQGGNMAVVIYKNNEWWG